MDDTRWRGLLVPLGVSTGDGRRFLPEGLSFRDLPLPLKWQRQDTMGHDDSIVVGAMEEINVGTVAEAVKQGWISEDAAQSLDSDMQGVWGVGVLFDSLDSEAMPRLAEDVAEVLHLLSQQVVGPSVDPGEAEAVLAEEGSDEPLTEQRLEELLVQAYETGVEPPIEILFTTYQIAAATLVPTPAFKQCRPFELLAGAPEALVAAVTGATDLPVADRETEWDGAAAARRVFDACTDGETVDPQCVSRAFLWQDPDADPSTMGAYKLGFADLVDGQLQIVPRGVAACAGGRGVDAADIPEDDKQAIRRKVCALYGQIQDEHEDWPDCPFDMQPDEMSTTDRSAALALVAAQGTHGAAEDFAMPPADHLYPLTVGEPDESGVRRVHGYIAAAGTCHTGFRECVTPPQSTGAYAAFHRYTTTRSGRGLPVAAGRITLAGGALTGSCQCCPGIDDHACNRLSMGAAVAHYDRAQPVAWVRAVDTPAGIWVSGVLDPDCSPTDLQQLSSPRLRVSGDWRETAGNLELAEVLVLSRQAPGFPIPRTHISHGRQTALVAAGPVTAGPVVRVRPAPAVPVVDSKQLARDLAAELAAGGYLPALLPEGASTALPPQQAANPQLVAELAAEVTGYADQARHNAVQELISEVTGV